MLPPRLIRRLVLALYAPPGARVVRVTVYLGRHRILRRTGHRLTRVVLRRLPARGTHLIRVVSTASNHSRRSFTRRYIACG